MPRFGDSRRLEVAAGAREGAGGRTPWLAAGLALAALGPGAQAQWPGFRAPVSYTTGGTPASVAIADFDGDGVLDLAVMNGNSASVSILRGNGDGSFGAPASYAVQSEPIHAAAGDLNGNGHLDLVVANHGSNSISVLLNHGDGTFAPSVQYTPRLQPIVVVLADFDRDGDLDIAVANFGDGRVSILLGNGNGAFAAAVNYTGAAKPRGMDAADFNGDGFLDLAVGNSELSTVSIFPGLGDGRFGAPAHHAFGPEHGGVFGLRAADFDRDGHADIVAVNYWANSVTTRLGNGDGAFGPPSTHATGMNSRSVAAGDLDGDGIPDVVCAMQAGTTGAAVLLGNGDGTLRAATVHGGPCMHVELADLDGNGALDLVLANPFDGVVMVLLNAAQARVQASATSIDFGAVELGDGPALLSIEVGNNGGANLAIDAWLEGDALGAYAINAMPAALLPPGGSTAIEVAFEPGALGPAAAELVLETNDPDQGRLVVPLAGTGIDTQPPQTQATGPTGVLEQASPILLVEWTGADNPGGSGLARVELFWRRNGGDWASLGWHQESPIAVDTTTTGGGGVYDFATIGEDMAGNVEAMPPVPDVSVAFNTATRVEGWGMLLY